MFGTASSEQLVQIKEIIAQLDHLAAARKVDNRRRADRVAIRSAMSAILLSEMSTTEVKIYSRNLSTSGIGFVSRRPFKTAERVAIPFEVNGNPGKLVLAKISFCRYIRAGMYTVGAEFIEAIADNHGRNRIPEHWMPGATLSSK